MKKLPSGCIVAATMPRAIRVEASSFKPAPWAVQAGLLVVDVFGLVAVSLSDIGAGRTGMNFGRSELTVGLDTIVSSASLGISTMPTVIPGVYLGLTGDAVQLSYDYLRFRWTLAAYSLVFQW